MAGSSEAGSSDEFADCRLWPNRRSGATAKARAQQAAKLQRAGFVAAIFPRANVQNAL